MKRRSTQTRRSIVAAIAIALVLPTSVVAHDNVDQKWEKVIVGSYDWYIRYSFTAQFPSQAFKDRVTKGAQQWNDVGRDFVFVPVALGGSTRITVTYEDLAWPNGDAWAIETNYKKFGFGEIYQAVISFNSTPGGNTWYTGTGTPGPSQGDVWSVAAHEFGHAVALHHSSPSADTMNAYISAGSTSKRSLTTHDKDGIEWWYPAH